MELTPRLQGIADQVPYGAAFADIGTDHAYLPVWLLLNGRIQTAIAADLREGPLARARETAAQYSVSDRISFRLCDGLSAVSECEADTIAIAGMGGETIAAILEAADKYGYIVLITADHGNADQMTETKKGKTSIRTAHSLNPVPFIIYDTDKEWTIQEGSYGLANVAPTVVKMMGLTAPACWEKSMV